MVRIRGSLPTRLLLLSLWVHLAHTGQVQSGSTSSSELPANVRQAEAEYLIPVEVRGYVSPPEGFSRHRHRPHSVSYSISRSGVFDSVQSDSTTGHIIGEGGARRGEVELSTQGTVRVEHHNVSQAMGDVGENGTQEDTGNRTARFFSFRHRNSLSDRENLIEENEIASPKEEPPSAALKEMYSDCLLQLSFTCLQKKMLLFLDRLARMEKFSLIGDYLTVVRVSPNLPPPITERGLDMASGSGGSVLDPLLDDLAERFLSTHVIRATLPDWVGRAQASGTTIDISLFTDQELTEEGRGKKGGGLGGGSKGGKGGGKKMMKKMMMMMGGLVMAKGALLLPLMMIGAKLKASAALLFSIIALVLSKIQLIKKLSMMMKGGGGGDDSGGGGGGGDEKHIVVVAQPSGGGHGGGGDSWSGGGGGGAGGGGWSGGGGGGGGASDSYGPPSGGGGGGGGGWSGGGGGGGWGRRVAGEVVSPHWLAYRGQIPAGVVD